MNANVESITSRLSLRRPQRDALDVFSTLCAAVPLRKVEPAPTLADLFERVKTALGAPAHFTDFEREFPNACFALATGVGKTRLMGAFIAYLHAEHGTRNFLVLAPNLTIYRKLIADFTPNTSKYVFKGLGEYASAPPLIVTGENFEEGSGVRTGLLWDHIRINIFNISKLNSETRAGKEPRIKRLSEYLGQSYYEHLAEQKDLVILMDEAHRYRADAGMRAIAELKPVLGVELTATPHIERSSGRVDFRDIAYEYPLAKAMEDGLVKEPAVATRENFRPQDFAQEDELDRIKLEDGVRLHEETKVELQLYAQENGLPLVKPFMLVVAKDTTHAAELVSLLESEAFCQGAYKGKVLQVDSSKTGGAKDESEETVEQLLTVERTENKVEIVVHVNMLKEGWDVTNLYTIVPLRAAYSRILVEQTIGRGLRLPYGARTGVDAVDRLTLVSHDHFDKIIEDARRPDSVIRRGVVIGKDVATEARTVQVVQPVLRGVLGIDAPATTAAVLPATGHQAGNTGPVLTTPEQRELAAVVIGAIRTRGATLRSLSDLSDPEVQASIAAEAEATWLASRPPTLPGIVNLPDAREVTREVVEVVRSQVIEVPRVMVVPSGEVKIRYREFSLDLSSVRYQPPDEKIVEVEIRTGERRSRAAELYAFREQRAEDYIVSGLIDFDDVDYDQSKDLLYSLATAVVTHLRSYLVEEDAVFKVLRAYRAKIAELVHQQLNAQRYEEVGEYRVEVRPNMEVIAETAFDSAVTDSAVDFRAPIADLSRIRRMLFVGFRKCVYPAQKFQSDPERRFAVVLEEDASVERWMRPSQKHLKIYYRHDDSYQPDFVVQTAAVSYLCEVKADNELADPEVREKAKAAALWCERATDHGAANGGRPWRYLLIKDSDIRLNATLAGLASISEFRRERGGAR
ncbi:MAG: DEAD/DEAH box helicase family protein [Anaeromyxobacter sp.]|nr:DEAD/DEAH box helicase family protein [Anaeromyxobacter sp.]